MITDLILGDNQQVLKEIPDESVQLVYGDCIYQDSDFTWAELCYVKLHALGILVVQTDFHTQHRYRVFLEDVLGMNFVNHLVWKCEWGNHPKNKFHQCYDDILIYSKGKDYKFYPDRIQVPKATVNTKLNPSGRQTKTATAWIDDIVLTTTSKERVKKKDGHLVRWQKPKALMQRIINPFVDENDTVLDVFMGSGTLAVWCKENNINYIGMENDPDIYELAVERLNGK